MTAWAAAHRGLLALSGRETARVLKLWTQTIAAPILSSALFIVVFGLSLGDRIRAIDGVPYDQFIVPGLIAMSMAQAPTPTTPRASSRPASTATSTTCSLRRCAAGRSTSGSTWAARCGRC
ncbi:MAG TPA: hypothetical protein VE528_02975 [Thermoleophilaceae bacterium]|nr:hypothetical protein [Thermoleophilaceae bacterium]